MTDAHKVKQLRRFLPLALLLAFIAIAYSTGILQQFNLEYLQNQKDAFQNYADENPLLSAMIFGLIYIVSVALSLPIATLLTLLGGFLFGKYLGTILVVGGATIGACTLFIIARTSVGRTLRERAGSLYKKIETNMQDNAVGYMLFMRLVPIFPFFLVNIVPALFNVSLRAFAITTFFGIMPGTFVYVNLGEQLGDINSLSDLISIQTLIAFALLGIFALIPTLYKQYRNR